MDYPSYHPTPSVATQVRSLAPILWPADAQSYFPFLLLAW
jgi:hypothetical protein